MDDERLSRLVGGLYDAATDAASLANLGSTIARSVGSESALVFVARKPSAQLLSLVSTSANFNPAARADYGRYYHERNEWFRRGARLPSPAVILGEELISYDNFDRTEFCTDWCSRVGIYHILAATIPLADGIIVAMGIHRPRQTDPFAESERRIVRNVLPHLARTLQIARRLGVAERQEALTLQVLHGLAAGLILVDPERRLLFMNSVAERLVSKSRWLAVSAGRLRTVHPGSAADFARAVGQAASTSAGSGRAPGALLRLRDPLSPPLPVTIAPFRALQLEFGPMTPTAAILFSDPDAHHGPDVGSVAAALGLSAAEARLVVALVAGDTLAEYAARTAVSFTTVRAQLRSVFLKTGHRRQAELVAAVLADPMLCLRMAPDKG